MKLYVIKQRNSLDLNKDHRTPNFIFFESVIKKIVIWNEIVKKRYTVFLAKVGGKSK